MTRAKKIHVEQKHQTDLEVLWALRRAARSQVYKGWSSEWEQQYRSLLPFLPLCSQKSIGKFASDLIAKWNREVSKIIRTKPARNRSLDLRLSGRETAHCHTADLFLQKQGDDIPTAYFKQSLTHVRTQTMTGHHLKECDLA